MNYKKLEQIGKLNKKICMFGAGRLGRSIMYDIIASAGCMVFCFFDNNIKPNTIVRDNIAVHPIEELYDNKEDIILFVSVTTKTSILIENQLKENDISDYFVMDNIFYQSFINSIIQSTDCFVKERYKMLIDDVEFQKRKFFFMNGEELNLEAPKTFNEKLNWMKLFNRNSIYCHLADKYEAKQYAAKTIGIDHVIPTIGIWNKVEEIDFNSLPPKFVLKCTHDSESVIIVNDKSSINLDEVKKQLEKALQFDYYLLNREYQYHDIPRKIIAEPLFVDESGTELKDYKFYVFKGETKLIEVDFNRFKGLRRRNLFTTEWNALEGSIAVPQDNSFKIRKPIFLENMINDARKMASDIPFVRVDYYITTDNYFFGEMTFFPGGGNSKITPRSLNLQLGDWITLPTVK